MIRWQLLRSVLQMPYECRIDHLTKRLIGAQVTSDAVGEGHKHKHRGRPLITFRKFDCQSFVEAALASVNADSLKSFRALTIRMRYSDGVRRDRSRHHSLQAWIEHNTRIGFLVPALSVQFLSVKRQSTPLKNSIRTVFASQISSSLISGVKWPAVMILCSTAGSSEHLGLAVKRQNGLVLRHAHLTAKAVLECPLMSYVSVLVAIGGVDRIAFYTIKQPSLAT